MEMLGTVLNIYFSGLAIYVGYGMRHSLAREGGPNSFSHHAPSLPTCAGGDESVDVSSMKKDKVVEK